METKLSEKVPFEEAAASCGEEAASMAARAAWRSEEDVPAEVWKAAEGMAEGKTAGPVATPFGDFFIRVEGRRKAGAMERDDAREAAYRKVADAKKREAIENYVTNLRSRAVIRVDMRAVDRI